MVGRSASEMVLQLLGGSTRYAKGMEVVDGMRECPVYMNDGVLK